MAKFTSRPWMLIGAVAILALVLSVVGPVLAQSSSGGTASQGGTGITLQAGDTLGTLVSRYNLSGNNLRTFFSQNTGLVLQPGQVITFPPGVTVNMGGAAGQPTGTATVAAGGLATSTPMVGITETATTAAGGVTTTTPMVGGTVTATTAAVVGAAQTTVTPVAGTTGTPTSMATSAIGTPTSAAGMETSTPAAGGVGAQPTYTTVSGDTLGKILGWMGFPVSGAAGGASAGTGPTDAQLEEFARLNTGLMFQTGQTAMLPAGIPQTGQNVTGTPGAAQGTYAVQPGDTLQSIASRFGITVQQLLQMNPNLLQPGMTLNVPGGRIPQTGAQAERTFTVQNNETLNMVITRFRLGTNDMSAFFSANCNVAVQPNQNVRFPVAIAQGGTTYTTKDGDTLCSLVNMMGLNLSQGAPGVATATPVAGAGVETATPMAGGALATATPATGAGLATATPVTGGAVGATATPAAGSSVTNQNTRLREFVRLNPNLRLQNGSTVHIPAGIPQTGGLAQAVGTPVGRFVNRQGCPKAPAGSGFYISRGGESLQSIANKFGVTLQEVMSRNPGVLSVSKGQIIMLPGVEAPGLWDLQRCNIGATARPAAPGTARPPAQPTSRPTTQPTAQMTEQPTMQPTAQLTEQPTTQPTAQMTEQPTTQPTVQTTMQPTTQPSQ